MRTSALLVAVFLSGPAMADLVAGNGQGDEVRLRQTPCTNADVLAAIPKADARAFFKSGQASINGKTHAVCWVDTGQGVYGIVFDDGDVLPFSITAFVEQPGV